jgi:carboxyl-terminal processing protease
MGVIPDVVLPSITDALEVGEAFLDHPLEHDMIRKAPDFSPLKKEQLFIPHLQQESKERVEASKDFAYVNEDIAKAKARIHDNKVSLNLADRKKELEEIDQQQQQRNVERKDRFAALQKKDKEELTFYKLTLDDVEKGSDIHSFDPSVENQQYMKRAKDETAELDDTPQWPSSLDLHKREGIMVLEDLVNATRNARMAGLLKR